MSRERKHKSENSGFSRRVFLRRVASTSVGTIATTLTGNAHGEEKPGKSLDTSKILNYNPKMGYRRLGKTGLILSEVSLGGHWKDRRGDRYWGEFPNEEVPSDVAQNRIEVVSACIDAGMNYVDIGTAAECQAYGVALKGRRDRMIVAADDYKLCAREPKRCTVEKLTYDIDQCLRRLKMDYMDIWRIKADMYGKSTDAHVEIMIETFEKAKKAGKVRYFGISSHRRPWLQRVIEKFPQIQIVSFPVSAKTREKTAIVTADNIEEVYAGYDADMTQSIFQAVRKHDIGVVAIKPFLGGNLFSRKRKFPITDAGDKTEHDLARLTLQCIIANDAVTTTVPGLTTIHEVENAVRASYVRKLGATETEKQWLAEMTDQRWAALDSEYAWLRDWEVV